MPTGSSTSGRKRTPPKPPRLVRGGTRKFGSRLTSGKQLEYAFRRMFPLSPADVAELHRHAGEVVRKHRIGYKWFFFSAEVTVLGGLYQVKFAPSADEERTWEKQWVSTPVTNSLPTLRSSITTLVEDDIPFQLANRPAWLLRIRLVFLRNHHKHGNVSQTPKRQGKTKALRGVRH